MQKKIALLFREATKDHQQGRWQEALRKYKKILSSQPRHADTLHLLGLIQADQGHLDKGLQHITRAIQCNSKFPPYYLNRGILYNRLKRYQEAVKDFNQAKCLGMQDAVLLSHTAEAFFGQGDLDAALTAYQRLLKIQPKNLSALHNLGNVYLAKEDYTQAEVYYQAVLKEQSNLSEAWSNLGVVRLHQKNFEDAITCQHKALEFKPNYYQAYINLGMIENQRDHFQAAEKYYQQALQLAPDKEEIYLNLGVNYKDQNCYLEALNAFANAQKRRSNYPEAVFNEAITRLVCGDFEQGLKKYEARLDLKERQRDIDYPYPRWQGEDLTKKRLLVHAEQGLGDTLQFVRYLKLLPQTADITLACQPELRLILSSLLDDDHLISRAIAKEPFDYQIPIMSLPLILKTRLDSIPLAEGYLDLPKRCSNARIEKTITVLQAEKTFKVGLVWQGSTQHKNDHHRSLSTDHLLPLLNLKDFQFYSLQMGIQNLPSKITDLTTGIQHFGDTALLLGQLDLLITVDTAIAHCAGAIGQQAWVLLPFSPDFRWLLERNDSPWYRSIRLFRQERVGDWESVIAAVSEALITLETKKRKVKES